MIDGLPLSYILFPIVALFGFLLRRVFVKVDSIMTEEEVRRLMDDKLTVLKVQQSNHEHDLSRIEAKMERELIQIHRKLDDIWNFVVNGKK